MQKVLLYLYKNGKVDGIADVTKYTEEEADKLRKVLMSFNNRDDYRYKREDFKKCTGY